MLDSLISAPPDSIAFSQRMRQVSEQWAVSAGAVVLESVVLVSAGLAVPGVLAVTGFGSVPLVVVVSEEEPSATGLGMAKQSAVSAGRPILRARPSIWRIVRMGGVVEAAAEDEGVAAAGAAGAEGVAAAAEGAEEPAGEDAPVAVAVDPPVAAVLAVAVTGAAATAGELRLTAPPVRPAK